MDYQNPAPTGDPNIRRVVFEHFRDSQGFQMRIRFLDIFLRKRFRFKDRTQNYNTNPNFSSKYHLYSCNNAIKKALLHIYEFRPIIILSTSVPEK